MSTTSSFFILIFPWLLLERKETSKWPVFGLFISAFFSLFLPIKPISPAQLIGTPALFYELECCLILKSQIKPIYHVQLSTTTRRRKKIGHTKNARIQSRGTASVRISVVWNYQTGNLKQAGQVRGCLVKADSTHKSMGEVNRNGKSKDLLKIKTYNYELWMPLKGWFVDRTGRDFLGQQELAKLKRKKKKGICMSACPCLHLCVHTYIHINVKEPGNNYKPPGFPRTSNRFPDFKMTFCLPANAGLLKQRKLSSRPLWLLVAIMWR